MKSYWIVAFVLITVGIFLLAYTTHLWKRKGSDFSKEGTVRDGFFGVSGIVKDKTYLDDLKVDIFRCGFSIGVSEEIAQRGKRVIDKNLKASVGNGSMPMITLLAGEIRDASWTKETLKKIVLYYTVGEGAKKIGVPIIYWEIGNEVNGGWGTSCDAEEYYNRVRVYASAIKDACPSCKVIMGGLLDSLPGDRDLEVYLERFLQLGGGEYIDIYNFHYYGTARPAGVGEYYRSGIHIYNAMKEILERYGYGDKPIWITETCTFSGRVGEITQTEEEQAADLVKRFVTMKALGAEKVFWCYIEEVDYEGGTDEGFFDQSGLIYDGKGEFDKGKGVKKKSYFAFKELIKFLNNTSPVSIQDDGTTYLALFLKEKGNISVLWQDPWKGNKSVKIIGRGHLTVYSMYGEKIQEGFDSLILSEVNEPVYIEGNVIKYEYLSAPPLQHP